MKKGWIVIIVILTFFGARLVSEIFTSELTDWRFRSQSDAEILREIQTFLSRDYPDVYNIYQILEEREPELHSQAMSDTIEIIQRGGSSEEIANAIRSRISSLYNRITYLSDESLTRYMEIAEHQLMILHREAKYEVCLRMAAGAELGSLVVRDSSFYRYELEMIDLFTGYDLIDYSNDDISELDTEGVWDIVAGQIIQEYGEAALIVFSEELELIIQAGRAESPSYFSCLILAEMMSGMRTQIASGNGGAVRYMLSTQ